MKDPSDSSCLSHKCGWLPLSQLSLAVAGVNISFNFVFYHLWSKQLSAILFNAF